MKNNIAENKFYRAYLTGFFIILFLPLLAFPPLFFPPEWAKSIVFRMISSIILFLFIWQMASQNQFWHNLIEKYKTQKKPLLVLAVLFLILLLSTLFSSDVLFSIWASPHRSGGFADFAFYIFLSIALFFVVKNSDWKKLWDFLFLIGDLVVLFAMVQYFNLLPQFFIAYEGRPPSTLSNPILLAIFLIFLIFPALSSIIKDREKSAKKNFYWISFLFFAFGILISGSRAAYIGVVFGGIYFLLFYPLKTSPPIQVRMEKSEQNFEKLFKKIKTTTALILLFTILAIACINIFPSSLNFIKNNQRMYFILKDRLSVSTALEDLAGTRFSAWQMFSKAVAHKPLLGWGAENQQIGFDRYYYYDPSLESLVNSGENWWDRAHNIFLDIAVQYGLIFLLVYLFFFGYLFWKLHKTKHETEYRATQMEAHGIQAIFIAYFITLLFGFDSVTTYIMLFFIIGYTLYLTRSSSVNEKSLPANGQTPPSAAISKKELKHKKIIFTALIILLVFFLWEYNLKPLIINAQINKAEDLRCDKKLSTFEKLSGQKSFLDSFLRLKYADSVKGCEDYIGNNETEYIKKSIDALKYSAKIQPNYTRTWIFLGQFTATLAAAQTDTETRNALLKESADYFRKAWELSPGRQEPLIGLTEIYFISGDAEKMKNESKECLAINAGYAQCYWYLGLSEIMLNDGKQGEQDIETAKQKGYHYDSQASYEQLAAAYTGAKDYEKLVPVYNTLITRFDDKNLQYHASLAFIYRELGQYKNAREEALKILELSPESKNEVNVFLNSLPY